MQGRRGRRCLVERHHGHQQRRRVGRAAGPAPLQRLLTLVVAQLACQQPALVPLLLVLLPPGESLQLHLTCRHARDDHITQSVMTLCDLDPEPTEDDV